MEPRPIERACVVNSAMSPLTTPPAGLAFLSGVCEHSGVQYQPHDLNTGFRDHAGQQIWDQVFGYLLQGSRLDDLDPDTARVLDDYLQQAVTDVLDFAPDCVCITVTTFAHQDWAEQFLRRLRPRTAVPLLAGGPGLGVPHHARSDHSRCFGTHMIESRLLDYYVLGEGDLVLQEFFRGRRSGIALNGHDCLEAWQPQLDDLDVLPRPSYRQIPLSRYEQGDHGHDRISITGSRGCVRRCSFCDVGWTWKKYRYRSGTDIVDELVEHYHATGATSFWFTDSLVNGNIREFMAMLQNVVDRAAEFNHQRLQLTGNFIVRTQQSHPEHMFQLMQAAGFQQPLVGIESGSERVRAHMAKKFSNQDIAWHFAMSEKYNIHNWVLMLVGYPTETPEDFEETLQFLRHNQRFLINQTILGMNIFQPFMFLPNTPLHQRQAEMGLHWNGTATDYQDWNIASDPALDIHERYRRFLDFVELAMQLRYPLPVQVQHHVDRCLQMPRPVSKPRAIMIQHAIS